MSNKEKQANSNPLSERLTLPWIVITIISIVAFMAFLIAMFFQFHTPIFFGVFLLTIAAAVLLDGIYKKRESYLSGNLNFIMAALSVICAVLVMNM